MSIKYWEEETPEEVKSKGFSARVYMNAGKAQCTTFDDEGKRKATVIVDRFTAKRLIPVLQKMVDAEVATDGGTAQ